MQKSHTLRDFADSHGVRPKKEHDGSPSKMANLQAPIPKRHNNDGGGKQGSQKLSQSGQGNECALFKKFNTDPNYCAYETHTTANCNNFFPDGNVQPKFGSSAKQKYTSQKVQGGGDKHVSSHTLKKLKKQKRSLTKMVLAMNMGKKMSTKKQLKAMASNSSSSYSSGYSDASYQDHGHCNNTKETITDSNTNLNVCTENATFENPVNSPSTPIKVAN